MRCSAPEVTFQNGKIPKYVILASRMSYTGGHHGIKYDEAIYTDEQMDCLHSGKFVTRFFEGDGNSIQSYRLLIKLSIFSIQIRSILLTTIEIESSL